MSVHFHLTLANHHLFITRNEDIALRHVLKAHRMGSAHATAILGFFVEFGLASIPVQYNLAER